MCSADTDTPVSGFARNSIARVLSMYSEFDLVEADYWIDFLRICFIGSSAELILAAKSSVMLGSFPTINLFIAISHRSD